MQSRLSCGSCWWERFRGEGRESGALWTSLAKLSSSLVRVTDECQLCSSSGRTLTAAIGHHSRRLVIFHCGEESQVFPNSSSLLHTDTGFSQQTRFQEVKHTDPGCPGALNGKRLEIPQSITIKAKMELSCENNHMNTNTILNYKKNQSLKYVWKTVQNVTLMRTGMKFPKKNPANITMKLQSKQDHLKLQFSSHSIFKRSD